MLCVSGNCDRAPSPNRCTANSNVFRLYSHGQDNISRKSPNDTFANRALPFGLGIGVRPSNAYYCIIYAHINKTVPARGWEFRPSEETINTGRERLPGGSLG